MEILYLHPADIMTHISLLVLALFGGNHISFL